MTLVITLFYLGFFFLGLKAHKNILTSNDFYVSQKFGHTHLITGSLVASIIGSSAIIGYIQIFGKLGWAAMWYKIFPIIGFSILLLLVPRIKKLSVITFPQMIELFYGRLGFFISSFLISIGWIGIISAQLVASASLFSSFLETDYTLGLMASASIIIFYTYCGGQLSIIKSDFWQFLLILLGLCLLTIYFLFSTNITKQIYHAPIFDFPTNTYFNHLDLFQLLLVFLPPFIIGPDILSRVFCAKDIKSAKNAVALSMILLIPISIMLTIIASSFYILLGSSVSNPTEVFNYILENMPMVTQGIILLGIASALLSSADTTLLTASTLLTESFGYNLGDIKSIKATRVFIILIGLTSVAIANYQTQIMPLLLSTLSIFTMSFFIPAILGILGTRLKGNKIALPIFLGFSVSILVKIVTVTKELQIGLFLGVFILQALWIFGFRIKGK